MGAEPRLTIKFDGRDADKHAVDMRALGRSMIGLDRIISDGVILLSERRLATRGERAHLIVKAQEPRQGSHEIVAFLQEHGDVLALGVKTLTESGYEIIWEWISFVLDYYGGRKQESGKHLDLLVEFMEKQLASRDKSEERYSAELAQWREFAKHALDKQAKAAIEAVAPIGPSARTLTLTSGADRKTVIDEPMADAIRAKGELEVGDLQDMTLTTDGWVYHSRTLSIHHPDHPGRFMTAKVRDPVAEKERNVYADAAMAKATVSVKAKRAYRAGVLESIYIMDFTGIVSDRSSHS